MLKDWTNVYVCFGANIIVEIYRYITCTCTWWWCI